MSNRTTAVRSFLVLALLLVPLLLIQRPGHSLVEQPAYPDAGDHTYHRADPIGILAWMAGCWRGTLSNGATYEEFWLPPYGGTLVGAARMAMEGRTLSTEFLRIVEDHGTIVYLAQPGGREVTAFPAIQLTDSNATFENPEHDFPQRILYKFSPPDSLTARIEGERDGQPRTMEFPLARVDCSGTTH